MRKAVNAPAPMCGERCTTGRKNDIEVVCTRATGHGGDHISSALEVFEEDGVCPACGESTHDPECVLVAAPPEE